MSDDYKLKHLEMLQAIVERMAANSFHVKGWSVAVVTALLALGLSKGSYLFANLAFFPLLLFWALDGYYLSLEKGFRDVYDRVRQKANSEVDFSMHRLGAERGLKHWLAGVFSIPNLLFHVPALAVAIGVSIYLLKEN